MTSGLLPLPALFPNALAIVLCFIVYRGLIMKFRGPSYRFWRWRQCRDHSETVIHWCYLCPKYPNQKYLCGAGVSNRIEWYRRTSDSFELQKGRSLWTSKEEYCDSSILETGGLGKHTISATWLVNLATFLRRSMVCVWRDTSSEKLVC